MFCQSSSGVGDAYPIASSSFCQYIICIGVLRVTMKSFYTLPRSKSVIWPVAASHRSLGAARSQLSRSQGNLLTR